MNRLRKRSRNDIDQHLAIHLLLFGSNAIASNGGAKPLKSGARSSTIGNGKRPDTSNPQGRAARSNFRGAGTNSELEPKFVELGPKFGE